MEKLTTLLALMRGATGDGPFSKALDRLWGPLIELGEGKYRLSSKKSQ
jgi:hypothetical protein